MKIRTLLSLLAICWLCVGVAYGAKKADPYKVLGVDKKASQRDIQKAFHKLSLQYHPDKNKSKGAQEKFAEINNAYEILSDEEKRKNYDLYGDERGNPGFDPGQTGGAGGRGGYTHFTSGPGSGGWQTMGGPGGSFSSFSFSSSGSNPFDSFDIGDIFGAFSGGSQFGGFKSGGHSGGGFKKSSAGSQSGPRTTTKSSIRSVSHPLYKKEIEGGGMTWLLLFKSSGLKDNQYYESLIEEVGNALQGVLKVGVVDCDNEPSMCKNLRAHPRRSPRLFVYTCSMVSHGNSLVEYNGDLAKKDLKVFCQEHLPRYSKPVDLKGHNLNPDGWSHNGLPSVLLLSMKKETPLIWRALSGQYRDRINFFNAQVNDVSEPVVKQLGVNSLPAIVGWLKNGEKHVLKAGITVKDMQSAMSELSSLLDGFEKKNKKVASSQAKTSETDSSASKEKIPSLTGSNFDSVCGENIPVCIIGAYRSAKERRKLESILSTVSQKPLSRQQQASMSYSLVDASKYPDFLKAFDKSGHKSSDKVLLAYKPRKGKFAVCGDDITDEEGAERFIGSVLSGDAHFSKTRQKPKLT